MNTIQKAGILTFVFLIVFAVFILLLTNYLTNPKGFTGRFTSLEDSSTGILGKIGDLLKSATNKTNDYSEGLKEESKDKKPFVFIYIPIVGFILLATIAILVYLFFRKT